MEHERELQRRARRRQLIRTTPGLAALAADLAACDIAAAAPARLEGILRFDRIDIRELARFVEVDAGRYTRRCVFREERFELVVLTWAAGCVSPVHDHGRSRCGMLLVSGELTVENYTRAPGGRPGFVRLAPRDTVILRSGDIDLRSAARDIHRISATAGDAVSLHVYAKPLSRYRVYDLRQHSYRTAIVPAQVEPAAIACISG